MILSIRYCVLISMALLLLADPSLGVKLKFKVEECTTYEIMKNEHFYGSFVALPDIYGHQPLYRVRVTCPSGRTVYESTPSSEGYFSSPAQFPSNEAGRYRFCIILASAHTNKHIDKEVILDLHTSDVDAVDHHAKEEDTQRVWQHVSEIDSQINMLRSTQTYMYWRERRHRETIESTNRRLNYWTIIRCCVLLAASAGQVLLLRYMFSGKAGRPSMPL